jgi:nitroreductase
MESLDEAYQQRYGQEAPSQRDSLLPFLQHRSIRRYTDETIKDDLWDLCKAAAQSAATSSNLQTWSAVEVAKGPTRDRLADLCGNQKQVSAAARFVVFLGDLHRLESFAKQHDIEATGLPTAEMFIVAVVDAALAAERMVCAAESQDLGICYIGGIRNHPREVAELLGLPRLTAPIFGLTFGYPAPSGASIKPKLRQSEVFFEEKYGTPSSAEYDARIAEFFKAQGMDASEPWSFKSAQRARIEGLSGRENLIDFLREQGFLDH